MSDDIGFVEAINGHNFKKLDIKETNNTPVADILARKKLGLKNHDTNINALVENNNPNVVLIHPQTMVNLVSTNEKARLHRNIAHKEISSVVTVSIRKESNILKRYKDKLLSWI